MASADWRALEGAIQGDVVLPASPGYESVRKPPIARFHDVRPQAVVLCETPADVAETISFARRSGMRMAVRSGGHCFAGRSSTRGVVIDVTPLSAVSVSNGMATVGAGARLGAVYDALAEHDLTIPAGCGPTVGIAGLTLGGGLGILGRKYGLTSDRLLAAQVVLADGRLVECDDHHHEDLFWALRGAGGGNFGVVTSVAFAPLPPPAATSFHLVWPHTHAATVIAAWQQWAPDAPDELAASLLVTVEGDQPPVVNLFGTMLGTDSDTAALLDELVVRSGADPTSAVRRHTSLRQTKRYLAGLFDVPDPAEGVPRPRLDGHAFSKSEFFARPVPADAITALVEHLTSARGPRESRELDFTPWGGAYNRVRDDATAFVHRDERFILKQTVVVDSDASAIDRAAARRWLARSWACVHPWGSGGVYPNFPDPELEDWGHAYYGANYDRLRRIKQIYDPANAFRFPQSL